MGRHTPRTPSKLSLPPQGPSTPASVIVTPPPLRSPAQVRRIGRRRTSSIAKASPNLTTTTRLTADLPGLAPSPLVPHCPTTTQETPAPFDSNQGIFEYHVHSPDVIEFIVQTPGPWLNGLDYAFITLALLIGLGPLLQIDWQSGYMLPWYGVAFLWLRSLCTRIRQEKLLVIRQVGFQLTSSTILGTASVRFIDKIDINDIVINEAITMYQVKPYLALMLENDPSIVVIFRNILPSLLILKFVYQESRAILFDLSSMPETFGSKSD
ncbi:GPI-GlcNAc transferase complex, PIG-H component-domain-containing protein [Dimargaris cristalligena]|uniref:GPI-GlcNAc transferase complex, PIG-H component-domain-containing protein n=1 Tax=Dimargaris cristalligena TaxID=215637 RepID=A0A4P9ZQH4_9FUNG|nr:GPI-GlcNAc transferase complex, PIG-H component-domain-containing protein [Dimargaris cristalligena]|eukprot:RKP35746.1 GPI-GlcNAc transferase complex, PIG-H component-domain-containing protein [Dimargaris cristalligena]